MDDTPACWTAVKEGRASHNDWFPKTGPLGRQNIRALEICNTECPIRQECLAWALQKSHSHYGLYGIWGGVLPKERQRMARTARRAA